MPEMRLRERHRKSKAIKESQQCLNKAETRAAREALSIRVQEHKQCCIVTNLRTIFGTETDVPSVVSLCQVAVCFN